MRIRLLIMVLAGGILGLVIWRSTPTESDGEGTYSPEVAAQEGSSVERILSVNNRYPLPKVPAAKRKEDMTRELAAALLNATPHISRLEFAQGDYYHRAAQEGIIQADGLSYRFTEKGLTLLQGYVSRENPWQLAGTFRLTSPITERVREVTGIGLGAHANICAVEYITEYILPTELHPLTNYVYTRRRATTTFQRYDDGWRVASDNSGE